MYADTSVYGGVFDEEFSEQSRTFFDSVLAGRFQLVVSALVRNELLPAPERVRELLAEMLKIAEFVEVSDDALALQEAYLDTGIVGAGSEYDALHVAAATVTDCRAIVSWNFKHIVNFRRIPLYNGVNLVNGYRVIAIHTPTEMEE